MFCLHFWLVFVILGTKITAERQQKGIFKVLAMSMIFQLEATQKLTFCINHCYFSQVLF